MKQHQISFLLLCLMIYQGAEAQFSAPQEVLGNGGGELSSSSFKTLVTAGQSTVGAVSNSSFDNGMGYWSFIAMERSGTTPSKINIPSDYATIQAGINAASNGDTVLVQAGTYIENINYNGKDIVVMSADGASNTIIDGNENGSVVTFESGESSKAVLKGFTIRNGYLNPDAPEGKGGDDPSRRNGAGIYCVDSSPKILLNLIIENATLGYGGGIWCAKGSPYIGSNVILNNSSRYAAGGIGCGRLCFPAIVNNLITNNSVTAGEGGGIYVGGEGDTASGLNITITNNTITSNSVPSRHGGGGIYVTWNNSPGIIVVNSIIRDNAPNQIDDRSGLGNYTYSDIQGGRDGNGNIDADPLFVDAVNNDYNLTNQSPCIGAGTSTSAPATDIDGNPRPNPVGSNPDMGAYENARSSPSLPATPAISLSATSLIFSNVQIGSSDQQTLIVSNTGNTALNVTDIFVSGTDAGLFSVSPTSFSVESGQSEAVTVTFSPTSTGNKSASLLISHNAAGSPTSVSLKLVGTDGDLQATYVIQAMANHIGLQDTVRIRVTDPDLNGDNAQKEVASVKVENTVSNEIENLTLEETEAQSGVFHGRIATVHGTAGTDDDGILVIAPWDTVLVQYNDELTTIGSSNTLKKQVFVINQFGDTSSNGDIRAFDAHFILEIAVGEHAASFRDSLVADVSGNNSIRAFDASLILQYIVGKLSRFPVQVDTTFESSVDWKNHPFLD